MHSFNNAPLFGTIKAFLPALPAGCASQRNLLSSSSIRSFVMSPMPHALEWSSTEIENKKLVKQYMSVISNNFRGVVKQMSGVTTSFGIVSCLKILSNTRQLTVL